RRGQGTRILTDPTPAWISPHGSTVLMSHPARLWHCCDILRGVGTQTGNEVPDRGTATVPATPIARRRGSGGARRGQVADVVLCSTPQRSSIGRPTTTRTSIRRASGR